MINLLVAGLLFYLHATFCTLLYGCLYYYIF